MFTFNSIPLVKLLIPFVLGIVLASYFPFYRPWLIYIAVGTVLITLALSRVKKLYRKFKNRYLFGLALFACLLILGFVLPQQKNPQYAQNFIGDFLHNEANDTLLVMVIKAPQEKDRSYKWEVEANAIFKNGQWIPVRGKCLLYAEKKSLSAQVNYGDQMVIHARLEAIPPPSNPHEFDYRRYLKHHYIFHRAYVKSTAFEQVASNQANAVIAFALSVRENLLEVMRNHGITGDEYAVLSALILGFKDHLDFEITQAFSSAGAMHVLAVSGLHVGIVLLLVSMLLKPLRHHATLKYLKLLVELGAVWSFAVLTGLSASVIRAATMFSFLAIGKTMNRNTNIYNTLAVSAFFILMVEPYMVMEVGFQLSFLAVLGILLIQPKLYGLLIIHNPFIDWVWTITTVSIAAQIATAPLGLLYFHQFPNYFIFSNLVVIPAAFVLVIGGVVLFITAAFPWIAEPVACIINYAAYLLNAFVKITQVIPYSISSQINISVLEVWLIYWGVSCALVFIYLKKKSFFFYGLGSLLILGVLQFAENIAFQKQRSVAVYSTKKHTAIDFISGNQHLFIGSEDLLNDPSSMQFNIWHNWWAKNLTTEEFILADTLQSVTHVEWNPYTVILLKEGNLDWKFCTNQSLIIVSEQARVPTKGMKNSPVKHLILDASLGWKARKDWIAWCEANNVNFWDVKSQGAFTASLMP